MKKRGINYCSAIVYNSINSVINPKLRSEVRITQRSHAQATVFENLIPRFHEEGLKWLVIGLSDKGSNTCHICGFRDAGS